MIQFYKPNKKVTGTACSFWMNRDKTMMASMIKQDGWNDKTSTGSFAKNKENPNGRVVVKLGNEEIAGIIDVLETNREWSTYHRSGKQKLQIKFCPYIRNGEQVGFSFSVNKQDTEDSTNKVGFIIGFSYPEGRYLKEYLLFLLRDWFNHNESKQSGDTKQFNKPRGSPAPSTHAVAVKNSSNEEQIEYESSDLSNDEEDFEW